MPESGSVSYGHCPIPLDQYPRIVMAHGGGGALTRRLINDMFRAVFTKSMPETDHDSAVVNADTDRIAMTTDSFVISPLFFPGGNIGELAVYGTVNDLCMSGAVPKYLSLGLVLEEGLPMETLWQIINAMQTAAQRCGVEIITGDTKVVERGKGDGVYINTTGMGFVADHVAVAPAFIRPGDAIIVSGDIGRHGIAVMASREGLHFETALESDCAPLVQPVAALLDAGIHIHCMRDLTRGGLGAALVELAGTAGKGFEIEGPCIPVTDPVHSACELLGFDPLFVANEGRFVVIVPENECEKALGILHKQEVCSGAMIIGSVNDSPDARVIMQNAYGGKRILHLFSGEQLPRIC